ncbi:nitrilase-related carbon-nitrogen hydrolase [Oceanithermus sp.]
MVRHALLQLKPEKGRIGRNLEHLQQALLNLRDEGVDVVVVPEAYPTGYFLQGGVRELALEAAELEDRLGRWHAAHYREPLDLVIGFYERDGGSYYNAAAYLELGGRGLVHLHRKIFLPTYGVFDEERFLDRGHELASFTTRFGRAALLICEDFWHTVTATTVALQGAEIIYVPSASPARGFGSGAPANVERWATLARAVSGEHGLYVALASLVGSEAGKLMSGGSLIAGPEGEVLAQAPEFEEAALVADVDLDRIPPVRYDNPMLADLKAGLPLIFPELRRLVEEL